MIPTGKLPKTMAVRSKRAFGCADGDECTHPIEAVIYSTDFVFTVDEARALAAALWAAASHAENKPEGSMVPR